MSDCSMFTKRIQGKRAMPFVGLYAAVASLICSIAMVFNSLHKQVSFHKHSSKFQFSSKFFALNATWLTLLAVATKLTGDLTSEMRSPRDNQAKITSTAFLTMAMGNFFTTLGSMTDKDILINVAAFGIMVVIVLGNLCIQLITRVLDFSLFPEIIHAIVLLFCMYITILCSALAVPAIKKRAELKYQSIHNIELEGQQHTVEEMRLGITKYWVMAASASPQFMMTRLVTFISAGFICLLSATIFNGEQSTTDTAFNKWASHCHQQSDYKWSVYLIFYCQYFSVNPFLNIDLYILLCILRSKYENNGIKISREEFIIESFWTEKLVEWRQSSIPMRINRGMVRKFLYNIKGLILSLCIWLQIVVVILCKFSCVVFFYTMLPFVFVFYHIDKCIVDRSSSEADNSCYLILLEGEEKFPKRFLRNIVDSVDKHVEMGKMKQSQDLFNLLNQSFSFNGIVEFDSNRVPSLLSNEPPNCWTLPVVTLTSIAIALPNIASQHVDWLVSTVDEGLCYARLIDVLDERSGLKSIKNVADVVWVGVELHNKWLDVDLDDKIGEVNSVKEIIQVLVDVAKRIVMEFSYTENRIIVENPLYWPVNVLAANSMYRISQTIMLYYENCECQVEELFRKLICMIADILTACLTNLPHLIATKCRCNAIEEREKSVRDAAILLGKTEHILKHFEERQLSSIGPPTQPLLIDEWRRWMERQVPTISPSATTSNGKPSTIESNEHVVVQMLA